MNARQKRLFEEAKKRNPNLKIPAETQEPAEWSEADLALVKQGVGDKSGRAPSAQTEGGEDSGPQVQTGSVVKYFEDKGFGFIRPDQGGRDVFFHVSRLAEGSATDLTQNVKVIYELGMDRTGKMAASSLKVLPPE
ncbi:MAG: cold shock domain-containing protein [Bryobacteraceae bacterium]